MSPKSNTTDPDVLDQLHDTEDQLIAELNALDATLGEEEAASRASLTPKRERRDRLDAEVGELRRQREHQAAVAAARAAHNAAVVADADALVALVAADQAFRGAADQAVELFAAAIERAIARGGTATAADDTAAKLRRLGEHADGAPAHRVRYAAALASLRDDDHVAAIRHVAVGVNKDVERRLNELRRIS